MTATATQQKITYTSANVDMEAFHRAFDAALAAIRASLGKRYPLYINDQPVEGSGGGDPIVDTSPIDTDRRAGHLCRRRAGADRSGGEGGAGWHRSAGPGGRGRSGWRSSGRPRA